MSHFPNELCSRLRRNDEEDWIQIIFHRGHVGEGGVCGLAAISSAPEISPCRESSWFNDSFLFSHKRKCQLMRLRWAKAVTV